MFAKANTPLDSGEWTVSDKASFLGPHCGSRHAGLPCKEFALVDVGYVLSEWVLFREVD
jgi:hypothetical protein